MSPLALIGYCLGGTMAIAAANLVEVERVITFAAPWHFARYPENSQRALEDMWRHSRSPAQLGALPMEVLQAAFWSLDPDGRCANSPSLPPSILQARTLAVSSSSRNGRTRAKHYPIRRRGS